MKLHCLSVAAVPVVVSALLVSLPAAAAESTLDYGFYKASVEPIFLKKRPEHRSEEHTSELQSH